VTSRILHVIPTLDQSGAEKQLSLLARGLAAQGEFEVHVAALTRGGPLEAELARSDVPVTVIGKRGKLDPLAFWRLVHQIRRLRPAIVHTWMFAANSYGRAAALRERVPHLIASERCVDPWKQWHQLAIDRYLARRTERIVVNSTGVREFYERQGIASEKFVVIPNGIDGAEFAPADGVTPLDRRKLLTQLDLPADARLIGAVGRLWPQKRVKDLIWAIDLFKVIRDDVHLLVMGDGPQRQILERYTRLVEATDRVHFLGHRADVSRILPHLDCVWLGSEYEGLPNVVMEAMLAARPVVATNIAGTRDLIVEGQTGYLVGVGDRASFVRRTRLVLEDAALAQRLGEAGRQRMLTEFGVDRMVEAHLRLYREVLGVDAVFRPRN
jgi:glycosyltransferase involved in cell wall biosynthesis